MEGEQPSPSSSASASAGGAVREKQRRFTAIKVKMMESFYVCKVTDMAEEIGSFCRKFLNKHFEESPSDKFRAMIGGVMYDDDFCLEDVAEQVQEAGHIELVFGGSIPSSAGRGAYRASQLVPITSTEKVQLSQDSISGTESEQSSGPGSTSRVRAGVAENPPEEPPMNMSKRGNDSPTNSSHNLRSDFTPADILATTNNFAADNIIGKGGQAMVFKGNLHGTDVAVKKFLAKDAFDTLAQEARILTRIRHPNILLLMGCCVEELCFVSEFMPGGSLRDRLRDSEGEKFPRFTWESRVSAAKDMVNGLYFLHSHNVLHHDLKPDNVLFDKHGTLKLADMGLAEMHSSRSQFEKSKTAIERKKGFLHGTIGYLDPAYLYKRHISPKFDIYALGLIIVQLCCQMPSVLEVHGVMETRNGKDTLEDTLRLFSGKLASMENSLMEVIGRGLLHLGLECCQREPSDRPGLKRVFERIVELEKQVTSDGEASQASGVLRGITAGVGAGSQHGAQNIPAATFELFL